MRKQLLCGVAAMAVTVMLSGPTRAADMAAKAAPSPAPAVAPLPNWSGLYLGGTIGYGWSKITGVESDVGTNFSTNISGALVGVHSGYNLQYGQWVIGYEGDYSGTLGQGWSKESCDPGSTGGCGTFMHGELHGLASMRARLGFAFDRTLIYATGGVGWGFYRGFVSSGSSINSPTKTVTGGVVGGGIEWRYSQNFSFRLEGFDYLLSRSWGQDSDGPSSGCSCVSSKNVAVIRFGGSYHF